MSSERSRTEKQGSKAVGVPDGVHVRVRHQH